MYDQKFYKTSVCEEDMTNPVKSLGYTLDISLDLS